MTQPKVSIIVPTYNVEQYIDECVGSLTNQTMHDIEILLSDDCSTDSTLAILHKLAEQDARIRIIEHERNVSASKCRKDAVLASHGEYIMFSDADDRYELNACAAAYEAIRREGTDIVQFDTFVENCGNVLQSRIDSKRKHWHHTMVNLKRVFLKNALQTSVSVSQSGTRFTGEILSGRLLPKSVTGIFRKQMIYMPCFSFCRNAQHIKEFMTNCITITLAEE